MLSQPWPQIRFSARWKIFWCKTINKFYFFICYKTPDIKKHLGFELSRSCVDKHCRDSERVEQYILGGSDPDKEKTPGGVTRVFASSTTTASKCTDQYRTYSTIPQAQILRKLGNQCLPWKLISSYTADLRSDHVLGAASLGSGLPLLHVVEACASSGTGWSPSSSCLFSSYPPNVDQHHQHPCSCFDQLGYPQHSSFSSKPFLIFSIGSNYHTQSVCHHSSLLWVFLSLNPSQGCH